MGGTVSADQPTQPTTGQSVQDWAKALPDIYNAQLKYAPLQAQQQVELAQQYALPMAQAMQSAQSGLYPKTTALQENLAGVATEGMSSQVPDWMQQAYRSNMNAQLGNNANAPIGADYMSRGLLQQQQDWQRYYQNLGLTVTGRQPLTQAGVPQTSDYMSGFTPGSVMTSNNQNYGTSAGIYGNQLSYNTAANQLTKDYIGMGLNMGGALMTGGMGGMGGGAGAGAAGGGSSLAIGNNSRAGAMSGFNRSFGY